MKGPIAKAIEAAGTLTGKRFGLLVASSVVATSAIVAAAMTNPHGMGPLAELLGRSLAADRAPAATAPPAEAAAPEPEPAPEPAPSPAPAPEPLAAPEAAPAPEATPAAEPHEPTPAPPPALPEAGQVKHVFLISLASPGYEAAFGPSPQMPYLANTLRPQGELLSAYTLLDASGLPNALASVSGQPPNASTKANCTEYAEFPAGTAVAKTGVVSGDGCVYPVEALTLADQLGSARFSWHAYVEGMVDSTGKAANCARPEPDGSDEPAPGAYAARVNPFVYFHSLLDLGDCATNDVPATELEKDLKKQPDAVPSFSYIAPTLCNSGAPGQCPPNADGTPAAEGAAAADAYLAQLVPKILASPAYEKDGLLIVAFGEAPGPAAGAAAPAEPLKTGALLVSRFLTAGSTDAFEYTPYSLLKSTEDLFGLGYLGRAASLQVRSFGQALRGGETAAGD